MDEIRIEKKGVKKEKPKFHLDKLLLWLFWIIMGGLFVYLLEIIPKVMEKIVMWVMFPLGVFGVIHIFLKEIFEIDIIEMIKKWKKN